MGGISTSNADLSVIMHQHYASRLRLEVKVIVRSRAAAAADPPRDA